MSIFINKTVKIIIILTFLLSNDLYLTTSLIYAENQSKTIIPQEVQDCKNASGSSKSQNDGTTSIKVLRDCIDNQTATYELQFEKNMTAWEDIDVDINTSKSNYESINLRTGGIGSNNGTIDDQIYTSQKTPLSNPSKVVFELPCKYLTNDDKVTDFTIKINSRSLIQGKRDGNIVSTFAKQVFKLNITTDIQRCKDNPAKVTNSGNAKLISIRPWSALANVGVTCTDYISHPNSEIEVNVENGNISSYNLDLFGSEPFNISANAFTSTKQFLTHFENINSNIFVIPIDLTQFPPMRNYTVLFSQIKSDGSIGNKQELDINNFPHDCFNSDDWRYGAPSDKGTNVGISDIKIGDTICRVPKGIFKTVFINKQDEIDYVNKLCADFKKSFESDTKNSSDILEEYYQDNYYKPLNKNNFSVLSDKTVSDQRVLANSKNQASGNNIQLVANSSSNDSEPPINVGPDGIDYTIRHHTLPDGTEEYYYATSNGKIVIPPEAIETAKQNAANRKPGSNNTVENNNHNNLSIPGNPNILKIYDFYSNLADEYKNLKDIKRYSRFYLTQGDICGATDFKKLIDCLNNRKFVIGVIAGDYKDVDDLSTMAAECEDIGDAIRVDVNFAKFSDSIVVMCFNQGDDPASIRGTTTDTETADMGPKVLPLDYIVKMMRHQPASTPHLSSMGGRFSILNDIHQLGYSNTDNVVRVKHVPFLHEFAHGFAAFEDGGNSCANQNKNNECDSKGGKYNVSGCGDSIMNLGYYPNFCDEEIRILDTLFLQEISLNKGATLKNYLGGSGNTTPPSTTPTNSTPVNTTPTNPINPTTTIDPQTVANPVDNNTPITPTTNSGKKYDFTANSTFPKDISKFNLVLGDICNSTNMIELKNCLRAKFVIAVTSTDLDASKGEMSTLTNVCNRVGNVFGGNMSTSNHTGNIVQLNNDLFKSYLGNIVVLCFDLGSTNDISKGNVAELLWQDNQQGGNFKANNNFGIDFIFRVSKNSVISTGNYGRSEVMISPNDIEIDPEGTILHEFGHAFASFVGYKHKNTSGKPELDCPDKSGTCFSLIGRYDAKNCSISVMSSSHYGGFCDEELKIVDKLLSYQAVKVNKTTTTTSTNSNNTVDRETVTNVSLGLYNFYNTIPNDVRKSEMEQYTNFHVTFGDICNSQTYNQLTECLKNKYVFGIIPYDTKNSNDLDEFYNTCKLISNFITTDNVLSKLSKNITVICFDRAKPNIDIKSLQSTLENFGIDMFVKALKYQDTGEVVAAADDLGSNGIVVKMDKLSEYPTAFMQQFGHAFGGLVGYHQDNPTGKAEFDCPRTDGKCRSILRDYDPVNCKTSIMAKRADDDPNALKNKQFCDEEAKIINEIMAKEFDPSKNTSYTNPNSNVVSSEKGLYDFYTNLPTSQKNKDTETYTKFHVSNGNICGAKSFTELKTCLNKKFVIGVFPDGFSSQQDVSTLSNSCNTISNQFNQNNVTKLYSGNSVVLCFDVANSASGSPIDFKNQDKMKDMGIDYFVKIKKSNESEVQTTLNSMISTISSKVLKQNYFIFIHELSLGLGLTNSVNCKVTVSYSVNGNSKSPDFCDEEALIIYDKLSKYANASAKLATNTYQTNVTSQKPLYTTYQNSAVGKNNNSNTSSSKTSTKTKTNSTISKTSSKDNSSQNSNSKNTCTTSKLDLNDDCVVDVRDYNELINKYQSSETLDEKSKFKLEPKRTSNTVNIYDINLFISEFKSYYNKSI